MVDEDFWKTVQVSKRSSKKSGRTGALNIALLFGTAAIALSLIATPIVAGKSDGKRLSQVSEGFDTMTTGSIKKTETGKHYTIRRSVLQETPGSVCIVQGYAGDGGC